MRGGGGNRYLGNAQIEGALTSVELPLNRSSVYDITFCMVSMTFRDIFPVIFFEFHTVK